MCCDVLDKGENMEHEEKLDSVQLEYLYLLQSQLASQKVHFEGIIERLEQQHHKEVYYFKGYVIIIYGSIIMLNLYLFVEL